MKRHGDGYVPMSFAFRKKKGFDVTVNANQGPSSIYLMISETEQFKM